MLKGFIDKFTNKVEDKTLDAKMFKEDVGHWFKDVGGFIRQTWKFVLIGIPLLFCMLWWSTAWVLKTDEIVKVTDKETKIVGKDKTTGEQNDVYFVYTDKGAFQFHQSTFFLQFEVADRFGKIERDHYYLITHYGFRNSFFDWYENIVEIKEIDPETKEVIKTL